jgi:hypothetical protein
MKKIQTLFKRDWDGDPSKLLMEFNPGFEWVIDNEGIPTRKLDGTAVMIKDGWLYRRYDRKRNRKTGEWKPEPEGWIECDKDEKTGHWVGWIPVDPKRDKWHHEAWKDPINNMFDGKWGPLPDGTYELCGPHFQGNPENLMVDTFLRHGEITYDGNTVFHQCLKFGDDKTPEAVFQQLKDFLSPLDIEGIVWHHPDGRMCKIKKRDLGLPRVPEIPEHW